ncbi:hypothetical protein GQ42DRAFT_114128, partial [Ramicandelaber brevisporus]
RIVRMSPDDRRHLCSENTMACFTTCGGTSPAFTDMAFCDSISLEWGCRCTKQ